jgi:simple sugar transport system ATP-binding protein
MLDERSRGAAILLISADLDEILALSDRITVMYEGCFMSIMPAEEATVDELGLLMANCAQVSQDNSQPSQDAHGTIQNVHLVGLARDEFGDRLSSQTYWTADPQNITF